MLTPEDLGDCAVEASDLAETLSRPDSAVDETVTRGLFLVAASLAGLMAAAYEIAASLRRP